MRAVCGESRTYGNEGVHIYTCSLVLGPTHPICSIIYGSTGATHFDQLAKILTGHEITDVQSSVLSHSCRPRRATRSIVLSHKISTPLACWLGELKFSSGQLSTESSAKNTIESCNARCCGVFFTFGAPSIPSLESNRKPPSLSDLISFSTLYIIASMILGASAAMAQTKVKRLLAHSLIGHVGYIRTGFSCGTIEGVQSLLIGLFIYASMTIDAFAIASALRQTCVKYIADLGALAKTNPISAITFSITMFSYAGIPPLAGFYSKFYLFFAALGCRAYFLAQWE
ncbi:hypothetical protein Cgig2_002572 [Carnegiea gigantea]|uniref:NADH:quinone oxidoreductase/Mrp antiporter transmembrane domain-containing protein n=1 Tax=Carnegiea gigantea TaxID=171969 RepID=A0A9Q1GIT7_9CARY|nr:hypothetical protein Cgig2_002572 [Carnegiea gigantea]